MTNSFLVKLLATKNQFALLPLRLTVGIVLMAHGAQKLFGWFGGGGIEGTGEFFGKLGFSPGTLWAVLAGCGEFFGGLLLFLGLFTRLGALAIAGVMGTAVAVVHRNAFFVSDSGMEFALTLFMAALAFLFAGGGGLSIDRMLAQKPTGKSEP